MSENYITFEELKTRLKPAQRLAAELLVTNEFAKKGEKKTFEQIAKEVGITDRQLYNWRQDPDFLRYYSAISDTKLDNFRALADSQLVKLIEGAFTNNGTPSIKALELYYKLSGRLQERKHVTFENESRKPTMTRDEISEQLKELDKYVN